MTEKTPRVIFFISAFYPFPTGATYSALRLARTLRERGVQIEWIVDDRDGSWVQGGRFEEFEVRSFYLTRFGKWKKVKALFLFTDYLWKHKNHFDIFHIHGGGHMNLLVAGWIKLLLPSKKVVLKCTMDEWDTPDGIVREKYGRILLWIYLRLDGVVAMTSGQHKKLVEYRCKGVRAVIPNGTDCERYKPDSAMRQVVRGQLNIPPDAPVLGYVGWLGCEKGTDVLLKTWEALLSGFPDLHTLAVGDYRKDPEYAPDREMLAAGVSERLLKHPQFIRIGHVEDAEHYLQAVDIFIFPSRSEGFGTVQTEAMACGLACVVNDLPGISCDIYPDESFGFRVAGNDVDEFVRIISDLLRHPEKRKQIGDAARKRVAEHFSSDAVAERYLGFYEAVLKPFCRKNAVMGRG